MTKIKTGGMYANFMYLQRFLFSRSRLLLQRPVFHVMAAGLVGRVRRFVRMAGASVALPCARARSPAAGRVPG